MHTPNTPPMPIQQKGYTIVELGIALTIIAVLIVAGLAGVTTVLNNSKANTQIEESGNVLAKLQSTLTSTNSTGMTTAAAVGSGYFTASKVSGNAVTSRFNGSEFVRTNAAELTFSTHGVSAPANVGAIYTITAVPKAVCANIASSLATLANAAWVYDGTPVETDAGAVGNLLTAKNIKAPGETVKGAAVGTNCNAANNVSLAFFLRP